MLKRILRPALILSFIVSTFSFGACDPAINEDYKGEILASFHGKVSSSLESAPDNIKVMLMWGRGNTRGELYEWTAESINDEEALDKMIKDSVNQQSASITSNFPAEFKVDLFSNPTDEVFTTWALSSTKSVEIAIGFFSAVKDLDAGLKFKNVIGVVENQIVYFIKSQADADLINTVKNANFVPGYNLMPWGKPTAADDAIFEASDLYKCREAYGAIRQCVSERLGPDEDQDLSHVQDYVRKDSFSLCREEFYTTIPGARQFDNITFGISSEACDAFYEMNIKRPEDVNMTIEMHENALWDSDIGYLLRALYEDLLAQLHAEISDGDTAGVYPDDL